MLKNKGLALFFLLPLFFVGCGGDNDLSPPEVQVAESLPPLSQQLICGEMEEGYKLFSGDTLFMDLMISDNEALSELKVDIHDNFDCHGHGGSQAPGFETPDISQETTDWTVLNINDLNGSEQQLQLAIPVPENVTAGFYHFGLQVVDAAGNEAESELIYELNVKNRLDTIPPFVNIDTPTNSPLTAARGEELIFRGTVTDNRPLDEGGNGVVYINYKKIDSENIFIGPFSVFPEGTNMNFDYDLTFPVPTTLTAGNYRLFIYAHDGVRNIGQPVIFDLQITD